MKRYLLRALAAVVACAPAAPVAAQTFTGATPVAAFADTVALRLTQRQLRDGVLLRVQRADSAVTLRFGIEDAGEPRPLSSVLAVAEPTVDFVKRRGAVQPHHDVRLTLLPDAVRPATGLAPGIYRGRVTIADTSGRIAAHRLVEVRVPGVEPLADSWRADIYKLSLLVTLRNRLFPAGELRCDPGRASSAACARDNLIPLRIPESVSLPAVRDGSTPDLAEYELLGALRLDEKKDHGLVWWTREPLRGDSVRAAGMVLHLTSFDAPGEYTGRVGLGSTADTTVHLTVRVTHDWPVPFGVLLIGVALSWLLQRYVRSRRSALMLDSDIGRLLHRIQSVDADLAAADSDRPGSLPFRMPDQIRWEILQADERLRRATRLRRSPEADAAMKKAQEALVGWEDEIVRWERFAMALNELADAVTAARAMARELRPAEATPDPALIEKAEVLLAGRSLLGTAVDDARHEIADHLVLLRSWMDIAAKLGKNGAEIGAAAGALWDAAEAAQIGAAGALVVADSNAEAAAPYVDGVGEALRMPAGGVMTRVAASTKLWLPAPVYQEKKVLQRRARRAEKTEKRNAMGYQTITFAVVTLTGLSQVYFGQTVFGTPGDYLGAFLWGFSGKLGIDLVRDVMDNRAVPWPKWVPRQSAPVQQGDPAV